MDKSNVMPDPREIQPRPNALRWQKYWGALPLNYYTLPLYSDT